MAYSSPPPPLQPAVPPPPPAPPHHDTTLTLALAPSPRPPPHARRPRPDGGAATAALARVRSSPTGDTPPCTECGKRFPSWKALFGHMRCHPESQWRGITPPPHFRHGAAGAPPLAAAAAAADQFTVQERDVATSLLMLAGARPGAGKGKKSIPPSPCSKESCGGTSMSSAAAPARCDDHKCSVCDRGFATGQALGGHKRCHWERACAEVVVVAASGSCSALATSSEVAATSTAIALDLNLPPPGPPLQRKSDQGSSLNAMLDLKLGY